MGASLCSRRNRDVLPSSGAAVYGPADYAAAGSASSSGSRSPQSTSTNSSATPQLCANCGKPSSTRCSKCRMEWYCGKDCQSKRWKEHKKECAELARRPPAESVVLNGTNGITNGRHEKPSISRTPLCGDGWQDWLQATLPKAVKELPLQAMLPEAPRVGFVNSTNNCYLSAVLQCLLHTPLLRQHVTRACPHPQDEWLAELAGVFRLVDEARKQGYRVVEPPRRLSQLIAKANDEFMIGRQADAHEAFMLLIARWLKGCVLAGDGSGQDCTKLKYAEQETLEARSMIGQIFGMQAVQTVGCNHCSHRSESTRVEYCVCLPVSIGMTMEELEKCRQESQAQMQWFLRRPMSSFSSSSSESDVRPTSVSELFRGYLESTELPDFKCEKCEKRGSSMWHSFRRLPNVLMIYFNRQQDGHMFGKINRRVSFSEHLDCTPFLSGDSPHRGRKTTSDEDSPVEDADGVRYALFAMTVHHDLRGSTSSGHYFAYVRDRVGNWHQIDDATVREAQWSEVQKQLPCMLFYMADRQLPPLRFNAKKEEKEQKEEERAATTTQPCKEGSVEADGAAAAAVNPSMSEASTTEPPAQLPASPEPPAADPLCPSTEEAAETPEVLETPEATEVQEAPAELVQADAVPEETEGGPCEESAPMKAEQQPAPEEKKKKNKKKGKKEQDHRQEEAEKVCVPVSAEPAAADREDEHCSEMLSDAKAAKDGSEGTPDS
eukprot:TRINITY_DN9329_c0_g2_i1.p1 TRINITY_DN9329_c0_g2~~TRINITY_DN9329_c0_g2_i1.p1  ORF type:complete len:719 (+),score=198.73 TRINITY_DN9329_c0_g2_i1:160-2316(+)